jgi:hypothetical protein
MLVAAPTAVADAFHVSNSSGTNLSGTVAVPATGGFQNWVTVTATVTLPAGTQTLTVNQDTAGWNIDSMAFASSGPAPVEINAGGPATGSFIADTDFNGGATINHANTIDLSGVTNPAPMAVYQTARVTATVGAGTTFSYTIPGFTANSSHTVRLHFAETFWTAAGQRVFNVSINGTQVLTNFDIFATAGAQNKAVIQQFSATADGSGQITIQFTTVTNKALISGIEIH